MNFKKYHVSKNLWNAIKYSYTSLSENNVWVYSTSLTGSVYRIPCKPNTTYTLYLAENVDITIWRIREVSTDVVPNASSTSVTTTGTYASSVPASKSATFTTSASAQYILFQTNESAYDSVLPVIMLIEGNTKIPYEPYSSEVWHDIPHYIHKTATDTLTLPATLYPNDTSITVGLKGNEEHTGTPTPDSPIAPQGTGERTGNLFNADSYYANYKSGNSYIATTANFNNTIISPFTTSDIGKTYTISCDITDISSTNVRWVATINGVSVNGDGRSNVGQIKLTFTVATANDSIRITYGSGNYSLTITKIIMNEGSTALSYEPFGIKIPISSNSITTLVYLGEVETTRQIKELVLNGTENWLVESGVNGLFTLPNVTPLIQYNNQLCTHFSLASSYAYFYNTDLTFAITTRPCILIHYNACQTVSAFKAFLAAEYSAGHPVTIWYVLAEPTTGILNEPIRKIGTYADEVSGITIPTIAGANVVDILTTLKPSEVSVNYHGWHPVADVHERENGEWT